MIPFSDNSHTDRKGHSPMVPMNTSNGPREASPAQTGEKRDPQTYAILGAAMQVHRQLGHGFLEAVYQEALALEFAQRKVPYVPQAKLTVWYKGAPLVCEYRADFICFGEVLVELKALTKLTTLEEAQVIHYLKATALQRALLINFGAPRLDYKRFVYTPGNTFDPANLRQLA